MSAGPGHLETSEASRLPAPVLTAAPPGPIAIAAGGASFARLGLFLLLAVVGSVIYGQAPLYTSNENQYFLHGLARAGLGFLRDDWLARTADPTPVFSFLVALTYRYLHQNAFYGYYVLMSGVYFYSLAGITLDVFNLRGSRPGVVVYLGLLMAMHAALLGNLSLALLGVDLRSVLTDGVAGQYIMGGTLEPSIFGVFLIGSIYAFLQSRPVLAVVSAVLAATVHPTYLLGAGVLILAYMLVSFKEGADLRQSLLIGLAGLALVLPIAGYVYDSFRPTSTAAWTAAANVLMNVRLPHHLLIRRWLTPVAVLQMAVILAGLFAVRKSGRLYLVLLLSSVGAMILTLLQVISGNVRLALLFPWRLSVYLVPIASSVLAAALVSWIRDRHVLDGKRSGQVFMWFGAVTIVVLFLTGALYMKRDVEDSRSDSSVPVMEFVRQTTAAGNVYFIPANLERFRLYTTAAVFVDRKSIPYKDLEVVEWYRRYRIATEFSRLNDPGLACEALARLSSTYRLTHAVLLREQVDGTCAMLRRLYEDRVYGVYRLVTR